MIFLCAFTRDLLESFFVFEKNLREAEDMVDDEVRSKNRLSIEVEDGLQKLKVDF